MIDSRTELSLPIRVCDDGPCPKYSRREKSVQMIELHTADTRTRYFWILRIYTSYKSFFFQSFLNLWLEFCCWFLAVITYIAGPTTRVLYITSMSFVYACILYARVCIPGRGSSRLVEIDRAATMFWTFRCGGGGWGWYYSHGMLPRPLCRQQPIRGGVQCTFVYIYIYIYNRCVVRPTQLIATAVKNLWSFYIYFFFTRIGT